MSDQIEIQIPRSRVPEGESFAATAYFRTRSTLAALAPTTVHYRVDCLTTKKELQDWTSVSAAANVSITMTSTFNAIQDGSKRYERKQLTIKADDGLSTQTIKSKKWIVDNLYGIS